MAKPYTGRPKEAGADANSKRGRWHGACLTRRLDASERRTPLTAESRTPTLPAASGTPPPEVAMSSHKRSRVVLVAELTDAWVRIVRALESDSIECDVLAPRTPPAVVVACAARVEAVVVVDVAAAPAAAMAAVQLCRRALPHAPVVVVASNPSLELTRSIRLSGAFFLAVHPVEPAEMSAVIASAFAALDAQRASGITCRARRRILVVDDDPDFRDSTRTLLEAYGYEVTTAPTGREGLQALRSSPPDLLVVDVVMEYDGAGYEVNEQVKYGAEFEAIRHVPVIMVSSIPVDPATRFRSAAEVGMITPNVYLTKPLDITRFLSEVRDLLGEAQAGPAAAGR
jgi:CheY-like chemotaxis protein